METCTSRDRSLSEEEGLGKHLLQNVTIRHSAVQLHLLLDCLGVFGRVKVDVHLGVREARGAQDMGRDR